MEHTVMVWGHRQTVRVSKKSKTVWVAVGDYHGETIRVEDRSEKSALGLWRKTAEYRGN
jgi:hypothetical protein